MNPNPSQNPPLSEEELKKQGKELLQSFVFYVEENRRNYDKGMPDIYDAVLEDHLNNLSGLITRSKQQLLNELEAEGPEDSTNKVWNCACGNFHTLPASSERNGANSQWRNLIARKRKELEK